MVERGTFPESTVVLLLHLSLMGLHKELLRICASDTELPMSVEELHLVFPPLYLTLQLYPTLSILSTAPFTSLLPPALDES